MRRLLTPFTFAAAAAAAIAMPALAQAPNPHFEDELRVLLVTHDPANPAMEIANPDLPRTLPLLRERAAAWEALLRYHFAEVTVVFRAGYRPEMSSAHDVTVFDAVPEPLVKAVRKTDPKTGERIYRAAEYLPATFDRAAITISAASPEIGEPLGLKLDWL